MFCSALVRRSSNLAVVRDLTARFKLVVDFIYYYFIILNDVNVWPENVFVREFVPSAPKNALGRHFPNLNVNGEQQMEH